MGLGQYDGREEYCGPHTASSVFLILVPTKGIIFFTSFETNTLKNIIKTYNP